MASSPPRLLRPAILWALWLLLLLLNVLPDLGEAARIPKRSATSEPARVTITGLLKTAEGLCTLPRSLGITITTATETLQFSLYRSPRVTQDALHFVPKLENGTFSIYRDAPAELEKYALYHDATSRVALIVTCLDHSSGEPEVEGAIFHKNRRLRLQKRKRRRRSTGGDSTSAAEYELRSVELTQQGSSGVIDIASPDDEKKIADEKAATKKSSERREEQLSKEDLDKTNTLPPAPPVHRSQRRKRSEENQDVYIDVIAIAAYDLYKEWYDASNKTTEAEKRSYAVLNIRKFLALVMAEVDTIYQYISTLPYKIHIRLVGNIVSESSSTSPWTELKKESATPRPLVNCAVMLSDLRQWVHNPMNDVPKADSYVLFTRYNLYMELKDGGKNKNVAGLAYLSGICPDSKDSGACLDCNVALVEVHGLAETAYHTVHEVGHGLGARHDGEDNVCHKSQNYAMRADGDYEITDENLVNHGQLSPCSIQYFKEHISQVASLPEARSCLYNAMTASDIPSLPESLPGQFFSVDDQCQSYLGSGSKVCAIPTSCKQDHVHQSEAGQRGIPDSLLRRTFYYATLHTKVTDMTVLSNVCLELFCSEPLREDMCITVWAARGTSCGDKKWCINGRCVYSDDAPHIDESCPFGDVRIPPLRDSNLTCTEHYAAYPAYCYDAGFKRMCCQTCMQTLTDKPDCLYGDRYKDCRPRLCKNYAHLCCRTCSTEPSTTSRPSTTPPVISTTALNLPTTTQPTTSRQTTTRTTQPAVLTTPLPEHSPVGHLELSEQCRTLFGEGSLPCMSLIENNKGGPGAVCNEGLYCSMPSNSSICYRGLTAAPHTPCGDKMWCENRQCVSSPDAPRRDPTCIFGDHAGPVYPDTTLTCDQLNSTGRGYCYFKSVRLDHCCRTCREMAAQQPVCPFGDYPGPLAVQFPDGKVRLMLCPDFVSAFYQNCYSQKSFSRGYCCQSCEQYLQA